MMARPMTTPTPAVAPCNMREAINCSYDCENVQATEPTVYNAIPQIITGRRPTASDSGPCTSEANANGTMYAVMTCCNCHALTCSAFSIVWNAGKKVSMENGLTIDSPPISTASIA